jgi:hypothetical protein
MADFSTIIKKIEHHKRLIKYHQDRANEWERIQHEIEKLVAEDEKDSSDPKDSYKKQVHCVD